MAVLIKGIRVEDISIGRDAKSGAPTISGKYTLISNADIVLATQNFNTYGSDLKITPAGKTADALHALMKGVTSDLESLLGLKEVSE